jgi:hypothetical protein
MLTKHLPDKEKFTLATLRTGIQLPGQDKPVRSTSKLAAFRRSKQETEKKLKHITNKH